MPAKRRSRSTPAATTEAELLALARSLPTTGDEVLCSPNVLPAGDPAAAIGRPPHSSDISGDYCYLSLGTAWKQASAQLLTAAKQVFSGSAEAAADARDLRALLLEGRTPTVVSALAGSFQTPPAPTGPHITIRSNLRPSALLPTADWRFQVTGVVTFSNPKLGQPSQWDPEWFCARWVALEVEWVGDCAKKQRGGWPHIAFASWGFRVAVTEREANHVPDGGTGGGGADAAVEPERAAATQAGEGRQEKKARKREKKQKKKDRELKREGKRRRKDG